MRNKNSPYFKMLQEAIDWESQFVPFNRPEPEKTKECELCGEPISHGKLCGRCKFMLINNPESSYAQKHPELLEALRKETGYRTGLEYIPGDLFDVSGEGMDPLDKHDVDIKAGGLEYDTDPEKKMPIYDSTGQLNESEEDDLGNVDDFEGKIPIDTKVKITPPAHLSDALPNVGWVCGYVDTDGNGRFEYKITIDPPDEPVNRNAGIFLAPHYWVRPLTEGVEDMGDVDEFEGPLPLGTKVRVTAPTPEEARRNDHIEGREGWIYQYDRSVGELTYRISDTPPNQPGTEIAHVPTRWVRKIEESTEEDLGEVDQFLTGREGNVIRIIQVFVDLLDKNAVVENYDDGNPYGGLAKYISKKTVRLAIEGTVQALGLHYEEIEPAIRYARTHKLQIPGIEFLEGDYKWIEMYCHRYAQKKAAEEYSLYENTDDDTGDVSEFEVPVSEKGIMEFEQSEAEVLDKVLTACENIYPNYFIGPRSIRVIFSHHEGPKERKYLNWTPSEQRKSTPNWRDYYTKQYAIKYRRINIEEIGDQALLYLATPEQDFPSPYFRFSFFVSYNRKSYMKTLAIFDYNLATHELALVSGLDKSAIFKDKSRKALTEDIDDLDTVDTFEEPMNANGDIGERVSVRSEEEPTGLENGPYLTESVEEEMGDVSGFEPAPLQKYEIYYRVYTPGFKIRKTIHVNARNALAALGIAGTYATITNVDVKSAKPTSEERAEFKQDVLKQYETYDEDTVKSYLTDMSEDMEFSLRVEGAAEGMIFETQVSPLSEEVEDLEDVDSFERPDMYQTVLDILSSEGISAEIRQGSSGDTTYKYIYCDDIDRPLAVKEKVEGLKYGLYGWDQKPYFKPGKGWTFVVAFTLADPNDSERYLEGTEPTLGDLRKGNVAVEQPIPPPPAETIPVEEPDTGDVSFAPTMSAWSPEEQAVIDRYQMYYPQMGDAAAIAQVSKEMQFPYAAAFKIITAYNNKFNEAVTPAQAAAAYDREDGTKTPGSLINVAIGTNAEPPTFDDEYAAALRELNESEEDEFGSVDDFQKPSDLIGCRVRVDIPPHAFSDLSAIEQRANGRSGHIETSIEERQRGYGTWAFVLFEESNGYGLWLPLDWLHFRAPEPDDDLDSLEESVEEDDLGGIESFEDPVSKFKEDLQACCRAGFEELQRRYPVFEGASLTFDHTGFMPPEIKQLQKINPEAFASIIADYMKEQEDEVKGKIKTLVAIVPKAVGVDFNIVAHTGRDRSVVRVSIGSKASANYGRGSTPLLWFGMEVNINTKRVISDLSVGTRDRRVQAALPTLADRPSPLLREAVESELGDVSSFETPARRQYFIDYVLYGHGSNEFHHAKFSALNDEDALEKVVTAFFGDEEWKEDFPGYDEDTLEDILGESFSNSDMDIIDITNDKGMRIYRGNANEDMFDDTEDTLIEEDWDAV